MPKHPPTHSDHLIQFKVSTDLRQRITAAADAKGVPVAGWLRIVADDAATAQLKEAAQKREDLERLSGLRPV